MSKIPANVQRGANLLDERLPGWRDYVDAETLNLADGCNCILGQVFGSYYKGAHILDVTGPRYGFAVAARQSWGRLTEAWRAVIAS